MRNNPHARVVAYVLAGVLILVAVVLAFTLGGGNPSNDRGIKDVTVSGKEVQVDADNKQEKDERSEAATPASSPAASPDVHEDARDENIPGVTSAQEKKRRADLLAKQNSLKGAPAIIGGAQAYSCSYHPVVNYSSRNGAAILGFTLHYTVSANRPGTSDLASVRGLFNTRSFGASSTYLIDFDGNCWQLVPESQKSWTQGFQNPWMVSVEIIATGRETKAEWLNSRLIKNGILAGLARDVLARHGLRLARGRDNSNCTIAVSGWFDHNQLRCNTHTDVEPNFPYAEFQRQLVLGVAGKRPPSKTAINQCKTLTRIRRLIAAKKSTQSQRVTAARTKRNLTRHKYKCTTRNGRAYIYRR